AGISDRTPVTQTAAADVGRVLDTNALGPVRVMYAFTPLLRASPAPLVVNVSRSVGSLAYASDPQGSYAELNQHRGTQTVEEGTGAIVALATIGPDGPTGTFRDRNGTVP
ncbi:MAG: hypothetical protein ACXVXI_10350, partial [Mycobacteriaceae bacterium]